MLGVELSLRVKGVVKDLEMADGDDSSGKNNEPPPLELSEFRLLLAYQRPSQEQKESDPLLLYGYALSTFVDKENGLPLVYAACPIYDRERVQWNEGIYSTEDNNLCDSAKCGFRCSKSRLAFDRASSSELSKVYLDFSNLEVSMVSTEPLGEKTIGEEGKKTTTATTEECKRICSADGKQQVCRNHGGQHSTSRLSLVSLVLTMVLMMKAMGTMTLPL